MVDFYLLVLNRGRVPLAPTPLVLKRLLTELTEQNTSHCADHTIRLVDYVFDGFGTRGDLVITPTSLCRLPTLSV